MLPILQFTGTDAANGHCCCHTYCHLVLMLPTLLPTGTTAANNFTCVPLLPLLLSTANTTPKTTAALPKGTAAKLLPKAAVLPRGTTTGNTDVSGHYYCSHTIHSPYGYKTIRTPGNSSTPSPLHLRHIVPPTTRPLLLERRRPTTTSIKLSRY